MALYLEMVLVHHTMNLEETHKTNWAAVTHMIGLEVIRTIDLAEGNRRKSLVEELRSCFVEVHSFPEEDHSCFGLVRHIPHCYLLCHLYKNKIFLFYASSLFLY